MGFLCWSLYFSKMKAVYGLYFLQMGVRIESVFQNDQSVYTSGSTAKVEEKMSYMTHKWPTVSLSFDLVRANSINMFLFLIFLFTFHDIQCHHMSWHQMTWHHLRSHAIAWHHKTWHDMISHDIIWHHITSHSMTGLKITSQDMTRHDIKQNTWQ